MDGVDKNIGTPRKDTLDSYVEDPSPADPPSGRRKPVGNPEVVRGDLPTLVERREPSALHSPVAPKADASPQTESKPSLLGRAVRKLKKIVKSKSFSALQRCRGGSHAFGRTIRSKPS